MFDLKYNYLVEDEPWSGILADIALAVRSMYHTKLQAMPVKMVFVQDKILNTLSIVDWESISKRKQLRINKNNQNENANRTLHNYIVG